MWLQAPPPYFSLPFVYSGVCPALSVYSFNRTRTSCLRLSYQADSIRLIGGTAGGELVVWGGGALGFEDLKRLPHSGGAVTALETDKIQDRIFVGDAAGRVAVLSLALSPIEADPLEVCLYPLFFHPSLIRLVFSPVSLCIPYISPDRVSYRSLFSSIAISVSLSVFIRFCVCLSVCLSVSVSLSLSLSLCVRASGSLSACSGSSCLFVHL